MGIDLLSILSQGASSLGAYRGAAAVASHNLQNFGTPGYARQAANLSAIAAAALGGAGPAFGQGVQLDSVTQARDRFLEAQMPNALAAEARANTLSRALCAVQVLNPGASQGLTEALGNFFSSLRALAQNAGSVQLRQSAIDGARSLAVAFNRTSTGLNSARDGLDGQLDSTVTEINSAAADLAALNRRIREARAGGGEPNDLLDARQQLQDKLAALAGAQPVSNGAGDVVLVLADGSTLADGDHAAQLSLSPDASNGGHPGLAITIAGSPRRPLGALGGTLGGVLEARDGALRQASDALDALAFDLASAVNTVHQTGYALDGSVGGTLFDIGSSAPGAASHIAVSAAVAADPRLLATASSTAALPGGSDVLARLIAVEAQSLSSGRNASTTLATLVAGFGSAAQEATLTAKNETSIREHLDALRASASGVSVDEELMSLTRSQQAYAAVGKVITTTQQMLETLMQLV